MLRALFFVNCINFFFCVLMYNIYNIANFSFAYIFKSYLSLYKKKEMKICNLKDVFGG